MKNMWNTPGPDGDYINALKRQVADLQKSEAFFRAVTQNSSDIIIVVNIKAVITYVNPSIEQSLGYKPEELVGKSGFDFIIPSDLRRAILDFGKSLLTSETRIPNAFGVRHKNGSTRILEGLGTNLLADPVVKGFVMNVRDITDRRKAEDELDLYRKRLEELVEKRTSEISHINTLLLGELVEREATEKALKESEEKYRDFIDNAPVGVGLINMSGKVLFINKRIEELMGWQREKIIGRDGFGLESFGEDVRRRLIERFGKRIEGDKPLPMVIPIARKGKDPLWVEVITTILKKDDVPTGAQMVFVNITERREAEDALRQSEARFRALIQRSSDVISILDEQRRFVYNSPSAEIAFGYPPEFLLGKKTDDFVHSDDREKIHNRFKELIDGTREETFFEFRGLKADRSWGFFEASGNNLLHHPGINGIVLTIRDIRQRKQEEEERKTLMERLHHAEKMESLGTLAGGVAHDLNNVLGALVGYTELMLTKMEEDDPLKKYLHSIMKSCEKAAAIIQDLLTLARRGVPISKVMNLNCALAEYFHTPEFDRLKSYHPHVTFKKDLAHDLLNLKGSPVHLGKTAMNLISNAVEAIDGEGEVTIHTCNVYLDKPVNGYDNVREGDYVALTIGDSGGGIAPQDVEKIFEPFYTKKVMGRSGTGLGLAVVWGTVKDHEGYIAVKSELGQGSTFTLFFPATREALKSKQQNVSMDAYMGGGESILVVDDMQEQREIASSLLVRLGYRVTAVSSGEEAAAYLQHHTADILLLDMLMDPGIDGLETYRRILETNPKQKAIIVSGYAETDRVKQALKLGAGEYVRKPYLLENIGTAIRKTLAGI